ncbi:MAG: hypothetical protein K2O42_01490, partial [Oscillospiraceae bacterium]|nr:hypothetical protein [Oscillospiraceae bacterium]
MNIFYCLILTDIDLCENFWIGIFSDKTEAEKIATYYLTNVRGFCEYPCTYRIEKKYIDGTDTVDASVKIETVWMVQGDIYDDNQLNIFDLCLMKRMLME